jgi:hypothetical protein
MELVGYVKRMMLKKSKKRNWIHILKMGGSEEEK